jgi:hypothetical protein
MEMAARHACPARLFRTVRNGEDIAGRTIRLHGEQGYGDTIQGLRYVSLVAARGSRVVLEAPQPLMRLAARLDKIRESRSSGFVARRISQSQTRPAPILHLFGNLAPLPFEINNSLAHCRDWPRFASASSFSRLSGWGNFRLGCFPGKRRQIADAAARPELSSNGNRIEPSFGPPCRFIAPSVKRSMVQATERDSELVAHPTAKS